MEAKDNLIHPLVLTAICDVRTRQWSIKKEQDYFLNCCKVKLEEKLLHINKKELMNADYHFFYENL